jgi:hypothetical protein
MHLALPTAHSTAAHHFSFSAWLHHLMDRDVAPAYRDATPTPRTPVIARNHILELKRAFGVTIECLEGAIWVTLDGDSRDVILEPGEQFTVDRDQRVLLQALEAARLRVVEPVGAYCS